MAAHRRQFADVIDEGEREEFGQIINQGRDGLGLNQVELAELIGLSQSQLSRIERGKAKSRVGYIAALGFISMLRYSASIGAIQEFLRLMAQDGVLAQRQQRETLAAARLAFLATIQAGLRLADPDGMPAAPDVAA